MEEREGEADALALTHREAVDPHVADLGEIERACGRADRGRPRAAVEQREPRPQVEVARAPSARA